MRRFWPASVAFFVWLVFWGSFESELLNPLSFHTRKTKTFVKSSY